MNIVMLYLDPRLGDYIRQVLELEGHTVMATPDADEALSQLAEAPALRKRVRVIGMSGRHDKSYIARFIADGWIDDHVAMPFKEDALLGGDRGEREALGRAASGVL